MRCLYPLHGWYSAKRNPSGKRGIVFNFRDGLKDRPMSVPCGQCIHCRLEKSRQWAVRCMHESQMHLSNCFITVTYDNDHLPIGGSLYRKDFTDFLKRLRRRYDSSRIRVFYCGEYGEQFGRPHFHAILFGFDFPDKVVLGERKGLPYWRSSVLESLWPLGRSEIGSVTFESAAYIARYVTKKITGQVAADYYAGRVPEFAGMSLQNGGIGVPWFKKFGLEVYPLDRVVMRGAEMLPPRAYDTVLAKVAPDLAARVKAARVLKFGADLHPDDRSSRVEVIEEVAFAKLNFFSRELK